MKKTNQPCGFYSCVITISCPVLLFTQTMSLKHEQTNNMLHLSALFYKELRTILNIKIQLIQNKNRFSKVLFNPIKITLVQFCYLAFIAFKKDVRFKT